MLAGPGLPDEAFSLDISNFFNQKPESDSVSIKKVDLNRSMETIQFMQELASKQDELLVSVIKIIGGIEVGQGEGGSPAWDTVKTSVSKDYSNIVEFCQAGLNKLAEDYPVEETNGSSETDDQESD
jgi:hypothetical protein